MRPVTKTPIDVKEAVEQIDANPELWNQFTLRKGYAPHSDMSDIWVRYNAYKNFKPRTPLKFHDEHHSTWYPAYDKLPALRPLIFGLMNVFAGTELGGVLITRVPPGRSIGRHKDVGWHAGFFARKFAIMLRSNHKQAFCFENESMLTEPGEVFEFDNAHDHWVVNDSDSERMTLICSLRTT